jgi:hypothetical protein
VTTSLLTKLREEIQARESLIAQLTLGRDMERGKVQLLSAQVEQCDELIRQLYQEIADLKSGQKSKGKHD